jgi:hypothetical protein
MILALHPSRRFPGGLDRGKEEADQSADDGDHNQQFNERECVAIRGRLRPPAGTTVSAIFKSFHGEKHPRNDIETHSR